LDVKTVVLEFKTVVLKIKTVVLKSKTVALAAKTVVRFLRSRRGWSRICVFSTKPLGIKR
jgi:hypothetical protein